MPIIPYSSPPVSLTTSHYPSHLSHLISSMPINVFTITNSFYISIPINPFRLSHAHYHISLSTPHHVSILLSILPHAFPLFIYPLNPFLPTFAWSCLATLCPFRAHTRFMPTSSYPYSYPFFYIPIETLTAHFPFHLTAIPPFIPPTYPFLSLSNLHSFSIHHALTSSSISSTSLPCIPIFLSHVCHHLHETLHHHFSIPNPSYPVSLANVIFI